MGNVKSGNIFSPFRVFISFLYNLSLLFYLLFLFPKLVLGRLKGKRHPRFFQRLGIRLPKPTSDFVIWIHAVSVGEIKAAAPFFRILKEQFPFAWFCVTCTTATGREEAKRSLAGIDAILYSPIDFSFVARRFVKKLKPSIYFLVESDFWPQLLDALKRSRAKIFLINGKLSSKTASRWSYLSSVANWMFSQFDFLCVQSDEYKHRILRFLKDPLNIQVTGNLKLDIDPQPIKDFPHLKDSKWITISCTHPGEEGPLLKALSNGPWSIFLAPRHPERFEEVAKYLENLNLSYIRWKDINSFTNHKIVLVDEMGQLGTCYSLSDVAIVGGSFVDHIGGHNVFEPCIYGCPSLFGPHTFTQNELVHHVLAAKAGLQKPMDEILSAVNEILEQKDQYFRNCHGLVSRLKGSSSATWEAIGKILQNN